MTPNKYFINCFPSQELQQVMEKFKKCAALLRGDGEDLSIQSPLFEMNKLSVLVYKYTGIVKVSL